MQITIDTNKDSLSDIKEALEFIKSWVEKKEGGSPITEESGAAFGNMFGDTPPKEDDDPDPKVGVELY